MGGVDAHTQLRDVLRGHARWILCHEENSTIRDLYSGFCIIEYSQLTSLVHKTTGGVGNRRRELLILSQWVSDRLAGGTASVTEVQPSRVWRRPLWRATALLPRT